MLQDRVDEILDDGTGRVRLELIPLAALIISVVAIGVAVAGLLMHRMDARRQHA